MKRLMILLPLMLANAAMAQGMLLPTDPGMGPLGIKYQRVSASIVDGTAVTKVEQVFTNSSGRQLEAHYVFPLPKGAALQEFYLWINGKRTKGEIMEKQKATDIYEGIVRRLQDPGLLEYIDTDAFRARVFPVPANGEQKIELTFSQVLDFSAGIYQYHYPLGAGTKGAAPLRVSQDFTFSAKINSKTPMRSIYSPTHKLGISRKSDSEAIAGLELGAGADISKDLDLFYTVSDKAVGFNFLSYRPNDDEPGYFMALVSPKTETKADEVIAKRVTFVVDTSGSMMGERIKLARDSMRYCIQRLNSRDEFNVVRFSTDVEALFETAQVADESHVKKALDFVSGFEASGGTAIDEAMLRGLKDGENRGTKPHIVMFITDGHPTVGATEEPEIAQHAKAQNKASRVFTFGVGEDLNARLLERMAQDGSGTSEFLRDGKEFEVKISGFFDKVANPVLADVNLDLSAFGAFDVYPKKMPDLFKGTQLVVMGRYRNAKEASVTLSGMVNGKKQVFEYRAEAAKESKQFDFVSRLWAIRKVGYLLEEIRLHGERPELKDECTMLGKKFGIVTPYTSYLVVEDTPMPVAQNRPQRMPVPIDSEDRRRLEMARVQKGDMKDFGSRGAADEAMSPPPPSVFAAKAAPRPAPPMGTSSGVGGMPASEKGTAGGGSLNSFEGSMGIAVAKKVREMKEEDAPAKTDGAAIRSASGRTFMPQGGAWVDSEAAGTKQLKVKYLSDAYFALLKARPELKAALALGGKVTVVISKGKSVVIGDAGETTADAVAAFLK